MDEFKRSKTVVIPPKPPREALSDQEFHSTLDSREMHSDLEQRFLHTSIPTENLKEEAKPSKRSKNKARTLVLAFEVFSKPLSLR